MLLKLHSYLQFRKTIRAFSILPEPEKLLDPRKLTLAIPMAVEPAPLSQRITFLALRPRWENDKTVTFYYLERKAAMSKVSESPKNNRQITINEPYVV